MTGDDIQKLYSHCTLCPRRCGADRYARAGFCGAGVRPKAAKAMIHLWEEPVLCESGGSGAVFFSHCTLKCVYCQNYKISAEGFGEEISIRKLGDIFLGLQDQGAQNIDLITASHYLPSVIAALDLVKHKLTVPVVYNCGGYESVESIRMLDGYVDIYLPDVKYCDDETSVRYSKAPSYFDTACAALGEMIRQNGKPRIDTLNGSACMKRGVIVRHMVLPSHRQDSMELLRRLAARFGTGSFLISILRQYTPFYLAETDARYRELCRRVTSYEYRSVADEAERLGFEGFVQEKSSAKEEYTPDFDLEGVL